MLSVRSNENNNGIDKYRIRTGCNIQLHIKLLPWKHQWTPEGH